MSSIALEGLEFFAYHGYYDEEQKLGNKYSVDIIVYTDFAEAAQTDNLQATVNYETLYQIVAEVMQQPARLLEHIAQKIIDKVFSYIPELEAVEVVVSKFNPAVGGICNRAKVHLRKINSNI